jgi:molybdate transport system ATP-binding protein
MRGVAIELRQRAPIPLDVACTFAAGELVALVGPSGAGKTTILRSIAGLYRPQSARVTCDGETWTDTQARVSLSPQARRVGFVFQSYALFPHLTALDNVQAAMQALPADRRRERARELLALVRLDDLDSRRPAELSGGQQQRVALARALAIEPEVLLLDEPLSNLDPSLREEMREQIRSVIGEFGVTTVFVTHDQQEALALADRIAIMSDGKCHQIGTPDEVYSRPADRFVANFIGRTNLISANRTAPNNGESVLEIAPGLVLSDAGGRPGPVVVFIRPENVLIGDSGHPARVVQTQFEGPIVQYTLDLGGHQVMAREFHRGRKPHEVGDDLNVSIPMGHFHVLDDDGKA